MTDTALDTGSKAFEGDGDADPKTEAKPFPSLSPGRDPTLLTASEMREADAAADSMGIDTASLMEAAGRTAADCLVGYLGSPEETAGEIAVLCGKGNNGGDGFVLARYLADWGYRVRLMLLGEKNALKGAAKRAAALWKKPILPIDPLALRGSSVIVDALIGSGLSRPIDHDLAEILAIANGADAFRFAVDMPTGLCSDTGAVRGEVFKADATVTFFRRKPGHVLAPGRYLCGGADHVHVVDIGIPETVLEQVIPQCYENTPSLWGPAYPMIGPATHKYDRGHVLVLGGREPALGASRLAAQAALRVGAGLCTLAAPAETYAIQAGALTDVMVRQFDNNYGFSALLSDQRLTSVVLGPGAGIGEKTAELAFSVLEKGRCAVLDADTLSSLKGLIPRLKKLSEGRAVLTPHEGEFSRLFPDLDIGADRMAAVREAAKRTNAVVLLKGVTTLVADPSGRVTIAANAPAWLSVGGTGDVLSGVIAGLLAQGMPIFQAASAGVWLHGEAAMRCGKGMIASDMLYAFKRVLP